MNTLDAFTETMVAKVEDLAQPLLESQGLVLVDVEFQRERHGRVLRIVIDKEGGVTLDECAQISRELGDLLDVKLVVNGPYNMEVSSPGLDRPLTKKRHFVYFEGRNIVLWSRTPIGGKKDFKGILRGVSGETVLVEERDAMRKIPLDAISKARLDF
jgi:ribosome maturation factor RimP